jgi:ABC-type sugar transport system ATPase subunit
MAQQFEPGIALQMRDISKSFPGVKALHRVSLEVQKGEVHAIVGENGAGKSTLMKILAGLYNADEGSIEILGKPVGAMTPREARDLGIGMIYQELNLVPDLTVAENISLGAIPRRGPFVDHGALESGLAIKPVVLGIGGTKTAFDAINAGEMTSTILQPPYDNGRLAVETLVKVMAGETVAAEVPLENTVVTKENIGGYKPVM